MIEFNRMSTDAVCRKIPAGTGQAVPGSGVRAHGPAIGRILKFSSIGNSQPSMLSAGVWAVVGATLGDAPVTERYNAQGGSSGR